MGTNTICRDKRGRTEQSYLSSYLSNDCPYLLYLRSKLPNNLGYHLWADIINNVGMCVFNIGLTYGLGAIGGQAGSSLASSVHGSYQQASVSPIYTEI
jgi:hypothetical protein